MLYYRNIKCEKQKISLIKLKDKFFKQKIENNYSVDIFNNIIESTRVYWAYLQYKLNSDSTFIPNFTCPYY